MNKSFWELVYFKLSFMRSGWFEPRILSTYFRCKGKVHPCTGRTVHRGSRGIALTFHDHGNRRGWGVSVTSRPLFTLVKDPVPIVQEAGWAPGPVWTGAENLSPIGIRFPDHPARSKSLYRLSYPAHNFRCRPLMLHVIKEPLVYAEIQYAEGQMTLRLSINL